MIGHVTNLQSTNCAQFFPEKARMYKYMLLLVFLTIGSVVFAQRATGGFYDGCNLCKSIKGVGVACTKKGCPDCTEGEVQYTKYQTCHCVSDGEWSCKPTCTGMRSIYDGCNNCFCGADGLALGCTRKACHPCKSGLLQHTRNTDCLCIHNRWSCKKAA